MSDERIGTVPDNYTPPDERTRELHHKGQTAYNLGEAARKTAANLVAKHGTESGGAPPAEQPAEPAVQTPPTESPFKETGEVRVDEETTWVKAGQEESLEVEGGEPQPATPTAEPTTDEVSDLLMGASAEEMTEVLDALDELGVHIPIDPAGVPPEMKPHFVQMVRSALEFVESNMDVDAEYEDLRLQKEQLQRMMQDKPEQVILSIALANEDRFDNLIEVWNKMRQDPDYKNVVLRDLYADAKLAEADRRTSVADYRERVVQGRKIANATRKAARKLGVNEKAATEFIAAQIKAAGPVSLEQIEPLVARLALEGSRPARRQVLTPRKAAAAKTAPSAPAGGGPAPVGGEPSDSRIRSRQPRTGIRAVVGNAFRRAMQTQ